MESKISRSSQQNVITEILTDFEEKKTKNNATMQVTES